MADVFTDVAVSLGYSQNFSWGHPLSQALQSYIDSQIAAFISNDTTIQGYVITAVDAAIAEIPTPGVTPDPAVPGSYLIGD